MYLKSSVYLGLALLGMSFSFSFENLEKGSVDVTSSDVLDSVFIEGMTIENDIFEIGLDVSIRHFIKMAGDLSYVISDDRLIEFSEGNVSSFKFWRFQSSDHEVVETQIEDRYRLLSIELNTQVSEFISAKYPVHIPAPS